MTVYRYIVVDLDGGYPMGCNDRNVAEEYSRSEDYIVLDAEMGVWLQRDQTTPIEQTGS